MKIALRLVTGALALAVVLLVSASCSKQPAAATGEKTLYTCSMHPQIIQDKPGNCPICGMKLEPIRKQAAPIVSPSSGEKRIKYYKSTMLPGETSTKPGKDSMGMDMIPVYEDRASSKPDVITVDGRTVQEMGVRTALVEKGPLVRDIRALARVDFDETAVSDVNVREAGWVEHLYVSSVGQLVHRGQPLFDFFSPELLVAEKEYLLAIERGADYAADTVVKLHSEGISDEQIATLEKTRQATRLIQVVAPRDGFVVEKNVIEGQMLDRGAEIYRIADLATVWVLADIYESDLPFIKVGQEATVRLSYLPDRAFTGKVTYIYPTVDEKTRAVKVRMQFYNPGYFLKPGMYASAEIHAELDPDAVLVPDTAILRSGETNTVFVAQAEGTFEPRTVSIGPRGSGGVFQVLGGLKPGERVVTSAQFLLDSESQLREAVQKMQGPGDASPAPMGDSSPSSSPTAESVQAASTPEQMKYVCPMPEHVSITYDHPGKCPICGMPLIPVQNATGKSNAQGNH